MDLMSMPVTPNRSLMKKRAAASTVLGSVTLNMNQQPNSSRLHAESLKNSWNTSSSSATPCKQVKTCSQAEAGGEVAGRQVRTPNCADRFIPNRQNIDFDSCHAELIKQQDSCEVLSNEDKPVASPTRVQAQAAATANFLSPKPKRMVSVFSTATAGSKTAGGLENKQDCRSNTGSLSACSSGFTSLLSPEGFLGDQGGSDHRSSEVMSRKKASVNRNLPTAPYKILDAPDMMDDYYLNLLHWSKSNLLGIALHQSVYTWNGSTGAVTQLMELEGEDYVTSVQWNNDTPNLLAVGSSSHAIQLFDAETNQQTRTLLGHTGRVSSLSWNGSVLSSGARDSLILHHDIRQRQRLSACYVGHQLEICGLTWSPDGKTLASGGNDNMLCLWDASMSGSAGMTTAANHISPRHTLTSHCAAVKALAWSPWNRHTLASGGGTADKTIKLWNAATGSCLNSVDTGSQVCALQWSDQRKELLSSHGFSDNQLVLWKYPAMTKVKEFRGHTSRVLHMAKSPDGTCVCSASADETLRFWDIFGSKETRLSRGSLSGMYSPRRSTGEGAETSTTPAYRVPMTLNMQSFIR